MKEEQTTFENMHEKRYNNHFTTNPLVFSIKDNGLNKEDIKAIKEITKDAIYAAKEKERVVM